MKLVCRLWLGMVLLAAAAQGQISNFQHIVIIVQENRTPDNLFQALCAAPYGACAVPPTASAPYDIQTSNWKIKGGTVQPSSEPLASTFDLGHSHNQFNVMCDLAAGPKCRMDGAASIVCTPNAGTTCPADAALTFVDNSTGVVNPYLALATQYGWANYMYQTNQGPSYPSHLILFAGTSAPTPSDDASAIFAAENMIPSGAASGCIAKATSLVELISPKPTPPPLGIENSSIYPCFEHQTMADLVTNWKYYSAGQNSIWTAPTSINHICLPSDGTCTGFGTHVNYTNPAAILTDLSHCKSSELTWVTPTSLNSDHPGANDGGGPAWVASIVNAIGNSKCVDTVNGEKHTYWQDTAILITWDDWGGWYDHEPPPLLAGVEGDYQYGFRVPLLFVSAYTSPGYVDNTHHDFGSMLRFVENNYASLGITEGELGFADSRATDNLSGFFNLTQAPRKFAVVPAAQSADFFINDTRPQEAPDRDDD